MEDGSSNNSGGDPVYLISNLIHDYSYVIFIPLKEAL